MIELKETIFVKRSIREAFRYTVMFEHIEQWDPGVHSAVKRNKGPAKTDTRYDLVLKFLFSRPEMTYRVTEYDPPELIELEGQGKSFSATDTIRFSRAGKLTRIDYTAQIRFSGAGARLEPVFAGVMKRAGKKAMAGLKAALDHPARFRPVSHPPCPEPSFFDIVADRCVLPGMLGFSRYGFKIAKHFWKPNTVFLTNRSVLITGATSGIGKAALTAFARMDADVTFIARNRHKAEAVRNEIIAETGNEKIDYFLADLSVMEDVRNVTRNIRRQKDRIDILVNNAGALFPIREETAEGLEKTMAVNLAGVFLLTEELAPLLSASDDPRIINVSSGGMYTRRIDVADLQYDTAPYNGAAAYARAKRGIVILTGLWAKKFAARGIKVNTMHPGWVDTPGIERSLPAFHRLTRRILRTPEQGADTIVWLASAPEAFRCTGKFWLDRRSRVTHVFPKTLESEAERRQLYQKLADLTGKRARDE